MIYEKSKKVSKIINWIYCIILIVIIVSENKTILYGCPVILCACIADIVLWLITCKKNKDSEEYPQLKQELIKSIVSFVLCIGIVVVFSIVF